MGLLAEARAKTEAKKLGSIDSNQSVGLLAEARARKNIGGAQPQQEQPLTESNIVSAQP